MKITMNREKEIRSKTDDPYPKTGYVPFLRYLGVFLDLLGFDATASIMA